MSANNYYHQQQENKVVSKDNVRVAEINDKFGKISSFETSSFSFLPEDERFFLFLFLFLFFLLCFVLLLVVFFT